MAEKSFFAPLIAWKNLFEKPVTIRVPKEKREAAERYRGFHINDWNKCIGCGTCAKICPTDAITMVEVPDMKQEYGMKPQRPAIDYGRCSFCAMCVDICTTGSLQMTREYIFVSPNPEDFYYAPTEKGILKKEPSEIKIGWTREDTNDLLDLDRVVPEHMPAEERVDSFVEFVKAYSKEEAIKEAARCVECAICVDRCPEHMQIPQYIKSIWKDDLKDALKWLLKGVEEQNNFGANPLSGVCGRVCTHRCEEVCAISHRGEAIAIRWLKRYIVDNVPANQWSEIVKFESPKKNKKVGIIGSGPAGLSAAYFLATMGYEVDIYESLNRPGGVMRYGIPRYRLPDEALDKDIAFIEALGVRIYTGVTVGKDIPFEEFRQKYDAIFVSTGLTLGRSTRMPGSDHPNVVQALPLLREIRDYLRGEGPEPKIARRVVVIGGGNVAMDIARSLARLQKMKYGEVNVTVTCLERTFDEMPADMEEIEEAQEEGVKIYPGWGPREVVFYPNEDKIKGIKCVKCTEVFDENRKFNPKFDETEICYYDGDMIIEAIGQAPDYSFLPEEWKSKLQFVGPRILTNNLRQTQIPWLFAGGDIVNGPDIIHAVADGYWAARGIDQYLSNQ
ncbi:FAD-dependent oxidoreductase [Fervidobacterium nodosum]|uniref:FAD-dependent pyridine nucleotide-disulphide oxidoreductase n=1 Tax=Fervidobacterium nodosum (strain ATCC 35602 / DSM 5306 / Rt17-B1) TaxID=381764 RepID=A7HNT7_FERNB|nr:FAD-dependent oxidoreductase [Fervidobacterium nodosum]ABS61570.1 FAD-dependent pyridine nucleotide-disulphide oxidoreductase [Fervidobacterium nodosum Rt17-B1]